ncbi:glycosyltransferase family 9 protein [Nibricoccus sp. IMCC34717]|uniref:glycosyltransferase family 9 protein n=1 Tax=Nibricoccus sp. IMCC34717 TaxID=3034021 RepID=UPI00384B2FB5
MTKILFISTSQLPDLVHSLQLATSLKAQDPSLHITWLVRDSLAPLVRLSPVVDDLIVFSRDGGWRDFIRMMRSLRGRSYDFVFDLQGLLRTGVMTWRAQAERKVGRADAREGANVFYHEKAPLPRDGEQSHTLEMQLQFACVLGLKAELRGTLEFRDVPGLTVQHLRAPDGTKPILLFPDSRKPAKCWSGFKELTELFLHANPRSKVIWAGHRYLDFRNAPGPDRFLNLTDSTSLVALPAMIRNAACVIANDSGPMHLAAALGVPTFGIFGPSDPRRYGPWPLNDPKHHVVVAPVGNLRMLPAREVYNRFTRVMGGQAVHGPLRVAGH